MCFFFIVTSTFFGGKTPFLARGAQIFACGAILGGGSGTIMGAVTLEGVNPPGVEGGGKGEGPCRPVVERQARRETITADTAPMSPDMINDGRTCANAACMHADSHIGHC